MGGLMTSPSNVNFSGADSYLQAAMSGLAARQRTIANNIANADTPNFKASEVRFEDALKSAISRGRGSSAAGQSSLNRSVSQSSLLDATSARADGNNVDIDREMELLGEANLNYSALTQVMSSRIGILRNVINGR
jgi:flagellar basal-body rod protein FlgB